MTAPLDPARCARCLGHGVVLAPRGIALEDGRRARGTVACPDCRGTGKTTSGNVDQAPPSVGSRNPDAGTTSCAAEGSTEPRVSPTCVAGAVALLRESWRNDGAEGESVHQVCDAYEAAVKRAEEAMGMTVAAQRREDAALARLVDALRERDAWKKRAEEAELNIEEERSIARDAFKLATQRAEAAERDAVEWTRRAHESERRSSVVWADEATPFTGEQVLTLLRENEGLRFSTKHLVDALVSFLTDENTDRDTAWDVVRQARAALSRLESDAPSGGKDGGA